MLRAVAVSERVNSDNLKCGDNLMSCMGDMMNDEWFDDYFKTKTDINLFEAFLRISFRVSVSFCLSFFESTLS